MDKIHIMGAAGAGSTTLGAALTDVLPHKHFDTDDYFWVEKFTEQRPLGPRRASLQDDLFSHDQWLLTGGVCGWADDFAGYFDLVVFLWIPAEIRLHRLKQREIQRYGKEAQPDGSKYETSQTFLDWAAQYDTGGHDVRSKTLHESWLKELSCPVLRLEGDYTVSDRVQGVIKHLNTSI